MNDFGRVAAIATIVGFAVYMTYFRAPSADDASDSLKIGRQYDVADTLIACTDRADFDQFVPLAAAKDYVAFDRLRRLRNAQGRCVDLPKGRAVYLDDFSVWGRVCVRPAGDIACVWTTGKALAKFATGPRP